MAGREHVLATAGYAVDWTGGFRGHTPAVLHPALVPRASCSAFASPAPAAPGATPGWRYNGSGYPAIEIAIYPDIIRLAAHNLRAAHNTSHRPAP